MVQAGVVYHLQDRMDGTCFCVIGSIDQTTNAGMDCGTRAHGARLNCSKELTVDEAMITEVSSGIAKGHDFRVCGGIAVGEVAVPAPADDDAFPYHDSSHGNFIFFKGALGAAQSLIHPELVGWICVGRICISARFAHSKVCRLHYSSRGSRDFVTGFEVGGGRSLFRGNIGKELHSGSPGRVTLNVASISCYELGG
jgi:hypothetical protein